MISFRNATKAGSLREKYCSSLPLGSVGGPVSCSWLHLPPSHSCSFSTWCSSAAHLIYKVTYISHLSWNVTKSIIQLAFNVVTDPSHVLLQYQKWFSMFPLHFCSFSIFLIFPTYTYEFLKMYLQLSLYLKKCFLELFCFVPYIQGMENFWKLRSCICESGYNNTGVLQCVYLATLLLM